MENLVHGPRKWEVRLASSNGLKLHANIIIWCHNNFKNHYDWECETYMNDYISDTMLVIVRFRLKKDAVAFELTWG